MEVTEKGSEQNIEAGSAPDSASETPVSPLIKDPSPEEQSSRTFFVRKYFHRFVFFFLTFAVCALFFFFLYRSNTMGEIGTSISKILQPILIGVVAAYLMNPIYVFFRKKFDPLFSSVTKNRPSGLKISKYLCITLAALILLAIFVLLIVAIVPVTVKNIQGVILVLPDRYQDLINFIDDLTASNPTIGNYANQILESIYSYGESFVTDSLLSTIQSIAGKIYEGIVFVFNLLVGYVIAINFLSIEQTLIGQSKKLLYALFKTEPANIILDIARHANEFFRSFLVGKIIDSFIIGVLAYIVLLIMGLNNAMLIAVIIGITNIIPFFGPIIGAVPSCLIALTEDPWKALWVLIFIIIIQQFDGNFLGPKILGSTTGLSPFWVLLAIIIFGGLWGFVGMVIGVPLMALIQYTVKRLSNYLLYKKGYPPSSEDFYNIDYIDPNTGETKMIKKD